ncbi:unnamed protein product [Staurois parvus]|uniref:Uncharacterized protein n=1 Tax=Staurois parvus TaxID=386267 RepID=A0ABN9DWB5_9NEOB|nr:unnamed protein product [Staurois parvus]
MALTGSTAGLHWWVVGSTGGWAQVGGTGGHRRVLGGQLAGLSAAVIRLSAVGN